MFGKDQIIKYSTAELYKKVQLKNELGPHTQYTLKFVIFVMNYIYNQI